MNHEDQEQRNDGGRVNDDGSKIQINEQRDLPQGYRLGTNPKPETPKPETGDDD